MVHRAHEISLVTAKGKNHDCPGVSFPFFFFCNPKNHASAFSDRSNVSYLQHSHTTQPFGSLHGTRLVHVLPLPGSGTAEFVWKGSDST